MIDAEKESTRRDIENAGLKVFPTQLKKLEAKIATPINVGEVVKKRFEAAAKPYENEAERNAAKVIFINTLERTLKDTGIKVKTSIPHRQHSGEPVTHMNVNKRTTPPVTLKNGMEIWITEEVTGVSPTEYIPDIYLLIARKEPNINPQEKTIYSAGNITTTRRESFAAVEHGKRASTEEIIEGTAIVNEIYDNLISQAPIATPINPLI